MRFYSTALVLLGLIVCAAGFMADEAEAGDATNTDSGDSNSANDPTEPKFTLMYWNYYATSLNDQNGGGENGEERTLIPFKIDGVQQILHIDPPVVTNPNATSGPRTGLGDTQIYNFTLTKLDIGPEKITFGIGPNVAVPTATSTNF